MTVDGDTEELRESKLEQAASCGDVALLRQLLEEASEVAPEELRSAMQSAAEGGRWDAVRYLVENAGIDMQSEDTGGVIMQYAAVANRLDIVELAVSDGASLRSPSGSNVLLSSAALGHMDVLRYAVEGGADVMAGGAAAAWGAAKAASWPAVAYLIEAGADLEERQGAVGLSLWALAAAQEQNHIVKLLEDRGVAVQKQPTAASEALLNLSTSQQWDVCRDAVKQLVTNGVDLDTEAGYAALVTAARYGDLEMVQCIGECLHLDMASAAAGKALSQAGELAAQQQATVAVKDYLTRHGASAPPPPALVFDVDF